MPWPISMSCTVMDFFGQDLKPKYTLNKREENYPNRWAFPYFGSSGKKHEDMQQAKWWWTFSGQGQCYVFLCIGHLVFWNITSQ